jgi:pteridine reductase
MKLALITAGYHRLGAVIAGRLAEQGWAIALHSRKPTEPDQDLAVQLRASLTSWHGFQADLTDPQAVARLIPDVTAHFGGAPDLLVNNASVFQWDDPATVTAEAMALHTAVNLTAPVMLATALAKAIAPDQRASVVNILDQRVRQPNGDQLSYILSKQGLTGATQTLAVALAPHIRVNGVAPGLVIPTEDYLPAQMVRLEKAMPLGRLAEPEDIADAVLYFANAGAVTGQVVCVDGGASLKSFDRDFQFLERE